jgi:hypothetical protein
MLPLNSDQAKAKEEFIDFLLDPLEKEMKLIGRGGTGKSYLVSDLIRDALKTYQENCKVLGLEPEYTNYALTAMTNRAAQELADATGMDVTTIHSYLGLAVRANRATGKQDLKRTASHTIREKVLIFVDESVSMMESSLLDELRASTMNCKIVFVGDDKQLDPIESAVSPVANLQVRTAELRQPMRNAVNPDGTPAPPYLKDLCDLFWNNVEAQVQSNGMAPWPMIQLHPGYIDHVDDAGLKHILDTEFLVSNGRNAIAAFSNSKVNDYNNYLRGLRGMNHLFQVGERLISNDMFEFGRFRIRNEQTVEICEADPNVTMIKIGDLDVPTQHVRITADPSVLIPVILDRDFHRDAIKYVAKKAKAGEEDWSRYWDLQQKFADFRPRDAATIHKLQGSSKDLVVVDLNNIGSCNFPVMAARLLYVALSRARYRIILYGNLPSKYGGVIF